MSGAGIDVVSTFLFEKFGGSQESVAGLDHVVHDDNVVIVDVAFNFEGLGGSVRGAEFGDLGNIGDIEILGEMLSTPQTTFVRGNDSEAGDM